MAEYADMIEKLRELGERANKDANLDDRLRMDRRTVFAELGLDPDEAEKALAQIREDRIGAWADVLTSLENRGKPKDG